MTEADQRFLRRILMVLVAATLLSGGFASLQTVQASNGFMAQEQQQ